MTRRKGELTKRAQRKSAIARKLYHQTEAPRDFFSVDPKFDHGNARTIARQYLRAEGRLS